MKLTTILLLAALLQVSAKGLTQEVSIRFNQIPLEKAFKEIEKQTGYTFVYTKERIASAKPVTFSAEKQQLELVLNNIFQGQQLTYSISGKYISVRQLSENKTPIPPPAIEVSGKVMDDEGNPLVGASVKVKGTTQGTTTNSEGTFTLRNVNERAVLIIEYIGYDIKEIPVSVGQLVSVQLQKKINQLKDVVIGKGYYEEKQRLSVGNSVRITAKEIEKQPVQNPLLALQARVPGLEITQQSGIPGSGIKVRIQGTNSIGNSNNPLYVVDGVVIEPNIPLMSNVGNGRERILQDNQAGGGSVSGGNPLNFINPLDIETIDVLKDADATALYGSRAANGAIIITTKKGKPGKTSIDIDVQQGWSTVVRKMEVLNRRQYLDMRYEALRNDGLIASNNPSPTAPYRYTYDLAVWDTLRETNWQDALIGNTGKYTNANISANGGNSGIQFNISGTYNRQTTVFPGELADQRAALHASISSASGNQRFKIQFSNSYMVDDNRLPGTDYTMQAVTLPPIAPAIYNTDGTLNFALGPNGVATWQNPMLNVLYSTYKLQTRTLVSNLQISYLLMKDLTFRTSLGYTNSEANDYGATPTEAVAPVFRPSFIRTAQYGNRSMSGLSIEPQLNYNRQIGNKGKLDILAGMSIQQSSARTQSVIGTGYASDQVLESMNAASTLTSGGASISEYKYSAGFTRVSFNWAEKYLLTLNARRDASSRFGSENRFANFGSIGAGWIFSEEKFVHNGIKWLSFGKIRGSYGTTGSDQIGDYQYLSTFSFTSGTYQGISGLAPSGLSNAHIQWEKTNKLQFGLDLGLFNDRINIGITYAVNRSSNQLLTYQLPSMTGFLFVPTNFPALIENTNFEASLNTINVRKNGFEWRTGFNMTIARNKLVDFPGLSTSTYSNSLVIGQPLSVIRTVPFAGVNPATGLYQFYDRNGNISTSVSNPSDYVVYYNRFPTFYGGFNNQVSFKGLELDVTFQFTKQIGTNHYASAFTGLPPGALVTPANANQSTAILDRWQKPGDIALVQKLTTFTTTAQATQLSLARSSTFQFSDASFIRLKNVSISWNLPEQWKKRLHLRTTKIFLQAQNLLTITSYQGNDPENQSLLVLPPLRTITAGIQLGL